MALFGNRARSFFSDLSLETLDIVDEFYSTDAHFCDPLVDIRGVERIKSYYRSILEHTLELRFAFDKSLEEGDSLALPWIMHLRSKELRGGNPIVVSGISHLTFDEVSSKATYHRDYFDLGQLAYEHVPLVGTAVRHIKSKLSHFRR